MPAPADAEKFVSVCITPWWPSWRLPSPLHSDLPLHLVNPADEAYADLGSPNALKFDSFHYRQMIRDLERGGIDVACWNTFGSDQIPSAAAFMLALETLGSQVRLVPYLDINERTMPTPPKVVDKFKDTMDMFENIPQFESFRFRDEIYVWGARNFNPAAWRNVFRGLEEKGVRATWIGHFDSDMDQGKSMAKSGDYYPLFSGGFLWQPQEYDKVETMEGNFQHVIKAKGGARYIGSAYPMFRRYGYGINYTSPEGFQLLRKSWETSIKLRAEEVHLVTWNDHEEATEFAPTLNRGYTVLDINRYYADVFKGKEVPIEKTRLFLASPRSGIDGSDGYVDVTGIFAESDLPATITCRLIDAKGQEVWRGEPVRIGHVRNSGFAGAGIYSAMFRFPLSRQMGDAVQPQIALQTQKGNDTYTAVSVPFSSKIPWISIFDKGYVRDRLHWMVEVTDAVTASVENMEQGSDTAITLGLINSPDQFSPSSHLRRAARFRVTLDEPAENFAYFVLIRNGEQAAIIKDGETYVPSHNFEGNWGWLSYASDLRSFKEIDGDEEPYLASTILEFNESPSRYALPPDGGGMMKNSELLTGYPRDWYTVVAVRKDDDTREFASPLTVSRSDPDPVIVRFSKFHTMGKYVFDDDDRGLGLRSWGSYIPRVVKRENTSMLQFTGNEHIALPNELLAVPGFQIKFDLQLNKRVPTRILWARTGEIQIYIDNDQTLAARFKVVSPSGEESYVTVKDSSRFPVGRPVPCEVVVTKNNEISLKVDERLVSSSQRLDGRQVRTGRYLALGGFLDDDRRNHAQSESPDFEISNIIISCE